MGEEGTGCVSGEQLHPAPPLSLKFFSHLQNYRVALGRNLKKAKEANTKGAPEYFFTHICVSEKNDLADS